MSLLLSDAGKTYPAARNKLWDKAIDRVRDLLIWMHKGAASYYSTLPLIQSCEEIGWISDQDFVKNWLLMSSLVQVTCWTHFLLWFFRICVDLQSHSCEIQIVWLGCRSPCGNHKLFFCSFWSFSGGELFCFLWWHEPCVLHILPFSLGRIPKQFILCFRWNRKLLGLIRLRQVKKWILERRRVCFEKSIARTKWNEAFPPL